MSHNIDLYQPQDQKTLSHLYGQTPFYLASQFYEVNFTEWNYCPVDSLYQSLKKSNGLTTFSRLVSR